MILVYVRKSWPKVLSETDPEVRQQAAAAAVLGDWAQLPGDDTKLASYADAVAGVFDNTIVAVFDIDSWERLEETGRVRFEGKPSMRWAHLVGAPNPGRQWGDAGYARSVQCLDTRDVAEHYPSPDTRPDTDGPTRAVIGGFTIWIDPTDGFTAHVVPAAGGRVVVAPPGTPVPTG